MIAIKCGHCGRLRALTRVAEAEYHVVEFRSTGWRGVLCWNCSRQVQEGMPGKWGVLATSRREVVEQLIREAVECGDTRRAEAWRVALAVYLESDRPGEMEQGGPGGAAGQ